MIKTKTDLMKVVKHYKDNGEPETAIRFLKNFPMKNVNISEEIEKIKMGKPEKETIVETKEFKPEREDEDK